MKYILCYYANTTIKPTGHAEYRWTVKLINRNKLTILCCQRYHYVYSLFTIPLEPSLKKDTGRTVKLIKRNKLTTPWLINKKTNRQIIAHKTQPHDRKRKTMQLKPHFKLRMILGTISYISYFPLGSLLYSMSLIEYDFFHILKALSYLLNCAEYTTIYNKFHTF